jgi:hypothetical protein
MVGTCSSTVTAQQAPWDQGETDTDLPGRHHGMRVDDDDEEEGDEDDEDDADGDVASTGEAPTDV